MMQKVLPDVKKVGLLYCTAESNSDVQIKAAKKELDKLGLEYTDFTVSSSNEIQSVVESAVGKVDALYSPTDNTIAAGASQVGQICKENKLPFVTGEEGMCMAGGLFTLSINYKDLGYAAGEMAVKILKGEAKPEDMPIKHLSSKDLGRRQERRDGRGPRHRPFRSGRVAPCAVTRLGPARAPQPRYSISESLGRTLKTGVRPACFG